MVISERGLKFIARWEGKRNALYNDPAGHCTIGYGYLVHLGNCDGRASEQPFLNGLSDAEAMELLRDTVSQFASGVESRLKVPVTQPQFDALVSWAYNVGFGNVDSSALMKRLNAGDYAGVPSELMRWNKANVNGALTELAGLTSRRRQEGEMWVEAIAPTPPPSVSISTVQSSGFVVAPKLNMRNGAGMGYAVVGMLDYGTEVGVVQWGDDWSQIGDSLWVATRYLSKTKPVDAPPNAPPTFTATPQGRFYVGVHDLPNEAQIGRVWRNLAQRGLVVDAKLVTDTNIRPDLIKNHRRNGGVFVQRLAWTWQQDLPPQHLVNQFADKCVMFLRSIDGEADYVQIGNEPDLAHAKDMELSPEAVAECFNVAARAINAVYPNIKCGPAPIGWLGWAYGLHPADYDRRKWAAVDSNLCRVSFFHAYSQRIDFDRNA